MRWCRPSVLRNCSGWFCNPSGHGSVATQQLYNIRCDNTDEGLTTHVRDIVSTILLGFIPRQYSYGIRTAARGTRLTVKTRYLVHIVLVSSGGVGFRIILLIEVHWTSLSKNNKIRTNELLCTLHALFVSAVSRQLSAI